MGSRNRSRHPTFQVRASIFGRARVSFYTPNNAPTNLALRLRLYINFTVLYAPITRCCVPHALGSKRGRSFPSQGCNSVWRTPARSRVHAGSPPVIGPNTTFAHSLRSLPHLIRSTPLPRPMYAAASLTSSATLFRWAPPSSLSSPAVCRHWERQGLADGQACKMGSKCTFAHGPSQLGKPLGQDRELAKASECKSFQDQKWCQLGKACRYTHNGRWPEDSDKYPTDYRGAPKASSPESLTRDPQRDAMSALPGGKSDPTADPHDPPSSLLGQPAIIKRGHNFRPAKVRS